MDRQAAPDPADSRTSIVAAAERGDPAAQLWLAEHLAGAGQGPAAVAWLARAAQSGHPPSYALLGAWQVLGHLLPHDAAAGIRRLELAARYGEHAAAAFLAYVHASGLSGARDWSLALNWLIASARGGNARALVQVALLQPDDADTASAAALLAAADRGGFSAARAMRRAASADQPSRAAPAPVPWPELRARIDVRALLARPVTRVPAFDSPAIATYPAFLDEDHCRYVMAVAAPSLERAMVNLPEGGSHVHEMRTNSSMTIGPTNSDVLLQILNDRLARLTGEPVEHQEDSSVLRYRPGEVYDDHHDFFDPAAPEFRAEIDRRGQRTATALIYLNGDFEGGQTEFPKLGWQFRGRAGDAIVWRNVAADGTPEPRTLHAGRAPSTGEKWVYSKWFRDRPQPVLR